MVTALPMGPELSQFYGVSKILIINLHKMTRYFKVEDGTYYVFRFWLFNYIFKGSGSGFFKKK